jgi:prepilin-type N-terminal cleavage/methylation domain-containing protein
MKKGFTLIELLVVIAIIGVMMAAVIVSINPTKRLQDARDSNKKQIVASVSSAAETCLTKNMGDGLLLAAAIAACDTVGELVTADYLKVDPTTGITTFTMAATAAGVSVDYTLENGGATCASWRYTSASGKAACVAAP